MANFSYSYSAITTDFDLEPVIKDYFEKYPDGQFKSYEIVYTVRDQHVPGSYSYLIVFESNREPKKNHVSFYDFLKSYCTYEDQVAATYGISTVFPQFGGNGQQIHRFGTPKKA